MALVVTVSVKFEEPLRGTHGAFGFHVFLALFDGAFDIRFDLDVNQYPSRLPRVCFCRTVRYVYESTTKRPNSSVYYYYYYCFFTALQRASTISPLNAARRATSVLRRPFFGFRDRSRRPSFYY